MIGLIEKLSSIYLEASVRLNVVQPNESKDTCEKCGGACCKNYPGLATPEQFGAPDRKTLYQNLLKAFRSGEWVVDWLEPGKYDKTYFPRPNIIDKYTGKPYGDVYHGMWGGEGPCIFHGDKGCEKEFDERPAQCQSLVPNKNFECEHKSEIGSKYSMAIKWAPYQNEIEQAAEDVYED